jgi:hypothetical protein
MGPRDTLGAVIMMKTAVLHTDDINFTPWGIAIVKALVLAKFSDANRGSTTCACERSKAEPLSSFEGASSRQVRKITLTEG